MDNILKVIVLLHNYCQSEIGHNDMCCPPGYVDSDDPLNGTWREEQRPLNSVGRMSSNFARREVYALRDALADNLTSENRQIIWQNEIVNRGRLKINRGRSRKSTF
ncbi:hypothetical protein RN001_006715 [Aquatica leii]|uniref:Uncharacterized protein n=1 Tax=Aquatica leii TaxID=1421715 RepID=A0AAN7SBL3_9COLE|nr:hypothetical protein RN001_006715 [Aquatica leii]